MQRIIWAKPTSGLSHLALKVADLSKTTDFYARLDFRRRGRLSLIRRTDGCGLHLTIRDFRWK
ncbi:MAG: hypothetical protein ACLRVS_03475 [Lachnospiraceae bacterium]